MTESENIFLTEKQVTGKYQVSTRTLHNLRKEGALGTIFLGSSKLPLKKMEEVMNKHGEEGWDISFQLIEKHRMLFF